MTDIRKALEAAREFAKYLPLDSLHVGTHYSFGARGVSAGQRLHEALASPLPATTGSDEFDAEDMANVGRSLMERIADAAKPGGQLEHWHPANDPAEIVDDLLNRLHDVVHHDLVQAAERANAAEARATAAEAALRVAYPYVLEAHDEATDVATRGHIAADLATIDGVLSTEDVIAALRPEAPSTEAGE